MDKSRSAEGTDRRQFLVGSGAVLAASAFVPIIAKNDETDMMANGSVRYVFASDPRAGLADYRILPG